MEEEDEEDDGEDDGEVKDVKDVEDVEVEEEDEDDDDEDTGGGAFFFNLFASFSATESVALRLFRLFLGQSFEFALECVVLPHLQGLFDI